MYNFKHSCVYCTDDKTTVNIRVIILNLFYLGIGTSIIFLESKFNGQLIKIIH